MSQLTMDPSASSQSSVEILDSQSSGGTLSKTPLTPQHRKPYSVEVSRDDRVRIQLLWNLRWTYKEISEQLNVTLDQIKYSLNRPLPESFTPRRNRSGQKPLLNTPRRKRLVSWLEASPSRLALRWKDIPFHLDLGIPFNEKAVTTALHKEGFHRRVCRVRPVLTAANRQKRFQFTLDYGDWTAAQWATILWSDETYIHCGAHTRVWTTRRDDEEWLEEHIYEKERRPPGVMFWGSFIGTRKGPGIIWKKEWGKMNAQSYSEHILPLVHDWIHNHCPAGTIFMHDNAPCHAASHTKRTLQALGIEVIDWPPYSPDLNPIEHVWNWMKDYIQKHYPGKLSRAQLEQAVLEAWDAVPESFLENLIESMERRINSVHMSGGGHSRY
jgi:transposase